MIKEKWENREDKVTAEISILGECLIVTSQASAQYITSVARYVNEKLSELYHAYPRMSRHKIVALGAMNLADELIKISQEHDLLLQQYEDLQAKNKELEKTLNETEKLVKHYQGQYEELVLIMEEEG